MAKGVGYVLETSANYTLIFAVAGSVYLIALLCIHLLVPRIQPISL